MEPQEGEIWVSINTKNRYRVVQVSDKEVLMEMQSCSRELVSFEMSQMGTVFHREKLQ